MRLLHVFAGPFPTAQGTQALVGQTCRLLARAGHEVHLLTYAHGAWTADEPFVVHRVRDWPRFSSERSGPSWRKAALDFSLVGSVARLSRRLRFDVIHAHHYEALVAAALGRPRRVPLAFELHALFEPELPTYVSPRFSALAQAAGAFIDTSLPRLADGVIALCEHERRVLISSGFSPRRVVVVPAIGEPPEPGLSARPRPKTDRVTCIYVGNLDRYQGLGALLDGLELLAPPTAKKLDLLLVTASRSVELQAELRRRKLIDRVSLVSHKTPAEAWRELLSADFAVVPRHQAGGVPIKLVNALVAGRPVLVDWAFAVGLEHGEEIFAVSMRSPEQVAAGLRALTDDSALRAKLSQGAGRAAARQHNPEKILSMLECFYRGLLVSLPPRPDKR